MIKGANGTSLMTADFQKQVYEIARNMAKLDDKGLCEYVYDKVKADKKARARQIGGRKYYDRTNQYRNSMAYRR